MKATLPLFVLVGAALSVGCSKPPPPAVADQEFVAREAPELTLGASGSADTGPRELVPQAAPRPLKGGLTSDRYPNELPGFQLHADATWATLQPTVSKLTDVRALLGEPREASDIGDITTDYPGDDKAKQPLLIYDLEPGWSLYVYLVKSDVSSQDQYDKSVWDAVGTLEVVPDDDVMMDASLFGALFETRAVGAADAAWRDHRDEHGLTYSVYEPRKEGEAGRLSRISYGASDVRLKEVASRTGTVTSPAQPPASEERPMSNPPAEYIEPRMPAPGAMVGSLSRRFPEVRVVTSSSFAHDYGNRKSVDKLSIVDEECDLSGVVAAIVAYRGGWSPTGGSSDEDVLETLQAFVEDWAALSNGARVTHQDEPEDLKRARPVDLDYHAPRYAMHEVEGQRVAVASYFQQGHIGQRGRHWSYVVRAHRVKDGAVVDPKGTSLPQPRWFTEKG